MTSLSRTSSLLIGLVAATVAPAQINIGKSLFITDVSVVDDARASGTGAWAWGTLMREMAGTVPPSQFIEDWLDTWLSDQVVNGITVPRKLQVINQIKNNWPTIGGTNDLDPDQSPFRLLAIVNRADLVNRPAGQIAELRFLYHTTVNLPEPRRFFTIFEYKVPGSTCTEIRDWQRLFARLGGIPFGNGFNNGLQFITDQITIADPNNGLPNGSLLAQLRTNELGNGRLSEAQPNPTFFWDLREFNVTTSGLVNVTTKLSPNWDFLNTAAGRQKLADYLVLNTPQILIQTHTVPDLFQGAPFQAGQSQNALLHSLPPNGNQTGNNAAQGTIWWATGFGDPATMTATEVLVRHNFAINTCAGCHFQETGTSFVMAEKRDPGVESQLAGFLTGITGVPDPIDPSVTRDFNDLQRRAQIMQRILNLNCGGQPLTSSATLGSIERATGSRVH